MRWLHVREGNNRFNCPANYVQDYHENKRLQVGSQRWVFWSQSDESIEEYMQREKRIVRVDSKVRRQNKGKFITGYYLATILAIQG